MKARYSCMLFAAALAAGLATSVGAEPRRFGVKAGVSSSSFPDFCPQYAQALADPVGLGMSGLVCSGSSSKIFPTFGGFVEIPATKRVGVQAEVSYARRGLTNHFSNTGPSIEGTATIDYLDFGVLGTVTLHSDDRRRFYALAGPVIGIRVGQEGEATVGGISASVDAPDVSISTALLSPLASPYLLRRTTVSLGFGAGMSVGRFLVEFRFAQGLTSALGGEQGFIDLMNSLDSTGPPHSISDLDADDRAALARFSSAWETATMRSISMLVGMRF